MAKRTHSKGSSERRERAAKRDAALQNDFAAALQIKDETDRARKLAALSSNLPGALLPQAVAEIEAITNADDRSEALIAIAPRLGPPGAAQALDIAINIPISARGRNTSPEGYARANAIAALAPHIPDGLVHLALHSALQIESDGAKHIALDALIREIPRTIYDLVFVGDGFSDDEQHLVFEAFFKFFDASGIFYESENMETLSETVKIIDSHLSTKTKNDMHVEIVEHHARTLRNNRDNAERRLTGKKHNVDTSNNDQILYETSNIEDSYSPNEGIRRKDEGNVPNRYKGRRQLWDAVLEAEKVPESLREQLIAKLRIEIARATRPKWEGRLERGGELATLTAPQFLKRVHADDIAPDGTVHTEVIRAIDPKLMRAVDLYIAQRKSRDRDLGDAQGLKIVLSRPRLRATQGASADHRHG